MKLDQLRLVNFRQYYGDQSLRFAPEGERNVTVINGNNGAGKTGLLYALNWCLYGEKAFDTAVGEITNKRALAEAGAGTEVETQVQLKFWHGAMRYVATRTQTQFKVDARNWRAVAKSELMLMRIRSGGAAEQVMNPEARIETMLPSNVRTYFFFDGEKIDRFASTGHEEDVKQAIRNVLQIEVLERARDHLNGVAKDYQKELKAQSTGKLQELLQQEEQTRSQLEQAKAHLVTLIDEDRTAKRLLEELDNRLVEVKAVQELVTARKYLEEQQSAKEADYDELQIDIKELVSGGYVALAAKVSSQAAGALEEKRQRGQIPSGVREIFVQDLLNSLRCICGRPIIEHSTEYEHLVSLLKKAVPIGLEDLVTKTSADLLLICDHAQRFPLQLSASLEKCKKIEEELERLHDQLQQIAGKLQGSPLEEVVKLEQKRADFTQKKENLLADIIRLRDKIDTLQWKLGTFENELEKEKVQEAKAAAIYAKFQLARKAADTVEGIFEDFAASMREGIQAEARLIFQRLISKATQFSEIRLTDDYRLDVLDRWGYAARPEMSAGERQVLSLSFIAGMAKISGMEAPLVMDTPFGRLHSEHRENIVEHLPELTGQLTLFVQDEELRGTARRKLESRIGVEYNLEFDHATGCTRIVEVTQ